LAGDDLEALVQLALAMSSYKPNAGFAARFDLNRRVHRAVEEGLLSMPDGSLMLEQAQADRPSIVFGHGDITARNVLRSGSGPPVLIDWEWAGLYPRGWDLAFVWFSVLDTPGARDHVETAVPSRDEAWFWRSALLIQLLHLSLPGLAPISQFRANHEQTRNELIERVIH